MTTRTILSTAALAVAALLPAAAIAQAPAAPPAFAVERPIVTTGSGPQRLAVDMPLLAGASPFHIAARGVDPATGEVTASADGGLNDLRLFGADGREIGYLLVHAPTAGPEYEAAATAPIPNVDTDTAHSSGFEVDLGAPRAVDRLRVDGVQPPFMKRVHLEGSGDRERWTVLVDDATVFDLPDDQLKLVELRFAQSEYRYLRLTWDDTNSTRLARPASVSVGHTVAASRGPVLETPVAFERRPSEPGRSRFRIRLPAGRLPIVALQLEIGGGHVLRAVSVYEARLAGGQLAPVPLGRTTIRRVVRDGLTAASLGVPIESPTEAQLDLEVDDGDNPPLDLLGVRARFAELPWIYFEAPDGAVTARYGSPRLEAPRYDLEAVRPQLQIEAVPDAAWGETTALPRETSAAPGPLPTVGAPVDVAEFGYMRPIPGGDAGLVALSLDAAVMAHSAGAPGGFADVRVVDADDRQIPYVVERAAEPLSLDLAVERVDRDLPGLPAARGARSLYRVRLPYTGLPQASLALATTARVFDRRVTLAVERQPDRGHREAWTAALASARWIHADQDTPAAPLVLEVPPFDTTDLFVLVAEGDNAPLPIQSGRLLLPSYRLRLYRAEGASLQLAYGRQGLGRPQYDLALLAPQVIGAPAAELAPGEERTAAGSAAGATAAAVSPAVFWAALVIATLALLAIIVRLLRREQPAP